MNSNKTLLLLGGSRQQVPAIEKAKEMGFRTILIDYLPDNPGQYVADKWYQESTTDIEAVYRIAKEENVDGILPYASDPAALPAAIVCERMGLPGNPATSVEILGVKHRFREFLLDNGFPCPGFRIISTDEDLQAMELKIGELNFPIVIKPTDSSGSKGVSVLYSMENLPNAVMFAKEYSRNGILIAEEFIQRGFPDVIGGDIFVEDGKITLLGDMAAIRESNNNGLIPVGERRPNGLNSTQRGNLLAELQRLISTLGIKNGELNIEVLIDKDDIPHFLELGPRAGGNMIPIQLSDIYGVDLLEANVKAAMGLPVNLDLKEEGGCHLTYVLHSDKDGKFESIGYSAEIEPYIYRKVLYKSKGDPVDIFDGAGKALGIIFLRFPDLDLMNKIQKRLNYLIQVKLA